MTSKVSVLQTPAKGQAVTFRTELPQASRVVIPTAASRRNKLGRVFNMNVMELNILAGGDVQDGVGVFLGHVGQHFHLPRVQAAEGNFNALHSRSVPERFRALGKRVVREIQVLGGDAVVAPAIVVALTVRAAAQPRFGEDLVLDLPLLLQGNLCFEGINLGRPRG